MVRDIWRWLIRIFTSEKTHEILMENQQMPNEKIFTNEQPDSSYRLIKRGTRIYVQYGQHRPVLLDKKALLELCVHISSQKTPAVIESEGLSLAQVSAVASSFAEHNNVAVRRVKPSMVRSLHSTTIPKKYELIVTNRKG